MTRPRAWGLVAWFAVAAAGPLAGQGVSVVDLMRTRLNAASPAAPVSGAAAWAVVDSLLDDPAVPTFEAREPIPQSETAEQVTFRLPPEKLGAGVVGVGMGGSVTVRLQEHRLESFFIANEYAFVPTTSIEPGTARRIAERFARSWAPEVWGTGRVESDFDAKQPNHRGEYHVRWTKWFGEIETWTFAYVNVRCWDGKVVAFGTHNSDEVAQRSPKVGRKEAIRIATERCRQSAGDEGVCRVIEARLRVIPKPDRLVYLVRFLYRDGPEGRSGLETVVDAITGELVQGFGSVVPLRPAPKNGPDRYLAQQAPPRTHDADGWPSMVHGRVCCVSGRQRKGFPAWADPAASVFLTDARGGALSYVLAGPAEDYAFAALSPDQSVLVVQRSGQTVATWILDTGDEQLHTTTERPGMGPFSFSPDGKLLAMSCLRGAGTTDSDIYLVDLAVSLRGPGGQRRLIRLAGEDRLPAFRPGSPRIAFAHKMATRGGAWRWQVAELPYDKPPTEDDLVVLVDDLPCVHRLTWFPDGERLLVWDGQQVWIANTVDGARVAVPIADLRDPERQAEGRLSVADPTLDDTGEWLVFAGRTETDAAESRGTRIYRCRLDATEAERLSPLRDEPVPPYVFPGSGRSSLEVAKERTRELYEKRAQGRPTFPVDGWEQRDQDG